MSYEDRVEIELPGTYQFQIAGPYWNNELNYGRKGWSVSLPHQCDDWEISDRDDTIEEAREKLTLFIAEARAALDHLMRIGDGS